VVHRSGPGAEDTEPALSGADSMYIDEDDSQKSDDGIVDTTIALLSKEVEKNGS